jgi:peptidoglycan LD-endopeptidase CwlK
MASRDIFHLHPIMQGKARQLIAKAELKGVQILIYCTYRSTAEQNILYAKGRTSPGQVLTWAKGGESKHNHTENGVPAALAFDCVPTLHGRPMWNLTPETHKMWLILGKIALDVGLEWGGFWSKKKTDRPHFQITL